MARCVARRRFESSVTSDTPEPVWCVDVDPRHVSGQAVKYALQAGEAGGDDGEIVGEPEVYDGQQRLPGEVRGAAVEI